MMVVKTSIIIWNFCILLAITEDAVPPADDLIFPLQVDTPINSPILNLMRIFPAGVNFSMTSLLFLSRSTGTTEYSLAFYFDPYAAALKLQENLSRYLGGVFLVKVKRTTIVGNVTEIETVEALKIFVVDKMHGIGLLVRKPAQIVDEQKMAILRQLELSVDVKGQKAILVPEKVHYVASSGGNTELNRAELCFYAVYPPGFALSAQEMLENLQKSRNPLLQVFYEKYQVNQALPCGSLVPAPYQLDALAIGLLVLAVGLTITLVVTSLLVFCWIRIKQLHATVVTASSTRLCPNGGFMPKVSYQQNGPFAPHSWPLPAYPLGIYDIGSPLTRSTLPSSCAVNYEWQESTMDLAIDADSLTNGSGLNESTSDVPSITEDTNTTATPSFQDESRSHCSENTAL